MKYVIVLILFIVSSVGLARPQDRPDPWWNSSKRSDRSLPELVEAGWRIVGYSTNHGENSLSRDYILQHPNKPGAWHCNWFSTQLLCPVVLPQLIMLPKHSRCFTIVTLSLYFTSLRT